MMNCFLSTLQAPSPERKTAAGEKMSIFYLLNRFKGNEGQKSLKASANA